MMGWCAAGQHDQCKRQYLRFHFDAKGKIVITDEVRKCECPKRGCKCYVKRADRTKTKKTRKKK